ncbi:MAG: hypothetical protein QN168_07575 [Armatimonadota bacterium]|nr:hypothetical protein [Armatimonadota bacterium]
MVDARVDRLEAALQRLADAQARTEANLAALTARLDRLAERVEQLAEAQRRTEARVEQLAEAQRRTEARLEEVARAQAQTEARLEQLIGQVNRLVGVVGDLKGELLEIRYREKAAGYFQRLMLGIRSVPRDELERLAADAEARGLISISDHEDLLLTDLVACGRLRDRGVDAFLLAEISSIVDSTDVDRASRRARTLARLGDLPVVAAVAGHEITPEADREAVRQGVWRVLDGRLVPPDRPPPAS